MFADPPMVPSPRSLATLSPSPSLSVGPERAPP